MQSSNSVYIKKADLADVFNALDAMVNGEKQSDGTVRRFKISKGVLVTLGRAYRELRPHVVKMNDDMQDQVLRFSNDNAQIPPTIKVDNKVVPNPDYVAFKKVRADFLQETIECPFPVREADFADDTDAPIGALGDLLILSDKQ
jgi:hypothetical protein